METMFWDEENTKYVSFKEMDADVKLGLLCSNNITNCEVKYEVLDDLDIKCPLNFNNYSTFC